MTDTTTGDNMAVDIKSLIYTNANTEQAINTKEEAEVLNGLFMGNYLYEERKTIRDVKLSKLIDMI